ncbi:ClpP family protease [Paenibacillus xylaniclasticus]|uniref:ClpP family protease n=1 Tax=Paenibacillus xylaniclasticus TaxID=588083 RepID=UPI0013E05CFC|nr:MULTISPECIES: ATP-dependent Clp protease proteolytic subunit [Paenibacillus]GFN32587.1 ATP-dependent Clp protease proteolytic subunit 2 [Paenibacillus curdlanolyticus]
MDRLYEKNYLELVESLPQFEEYYFWSQLKKRRIILNSEVNDSLVERVIMQIIEWNEEDADKPIEERKIIEIVLNSPGGDVYLGLVLCSVIEKSITPILAASMGASILASAAKHKMRYAYETSNVLIHDGSTALMGTSNKVKDHMRFQEEKDRQVKDIILRNSKITEEKYDNMIDREWWITAKDALELGMIDYII